MGRRFWDCIGFDYKIKGGNDMQEFSIKSFIFTKHGAKEFSNLENPL